MSSSISSATGTLLERSTRATHALCEALGLGHVASRDLNLLTLALVEQAESEVRGNPEFARRIRGAFAALRDQRPAPRRRQPRADPEPLVAIGPVDASLLTPHGRRDPYALYRAYGEAQTRRLLGNEVMDDLRHSVAIVEAINPGTRPANRRRKDSLIEYIMAHLADGQ